MKNTQTIQEQAYVIYVGKKSLTQTNLSTQEYIQSVELESILTECTRIFLRKAALSPQQTISEYLSQCSKGEHVLLKSFSSFNKSAMNRICFIQNFVKIFQIQNHQRNGLDYYQLFRLLCSDFPKDLVVKSVNLVIDNKDSNIENNMAKVLNSRKFTDALYLNFIHTQYLESLFNEVFQGKYQSVPIISLAVWVYQKQKNQFRIHDKPIFSSVIQSLLNQIRKKTLINELSSQNFSLKETPKKVIFVNQKTCLDYIRLQCQTSSKYTKKSKSIENNFKDTSQYQNQSEKKQFDGEKQQTSTHAKISYEQFLKQLINQVEYHRWIKQNLEMFDNSIIWTAQTYKILSAKQNGDIQPLNQKKMKKK